MNRAAEEVLRRHGGRLMAIPGVVGTGEGSRQGRPCLLVMVSRRTPEVEALIPPEIDGIPVEIQEVGTVRALGGDGVPAPGSAPSSGPPDRPVG